MMQPKTETEIVALSKRLRFEVFKRDGFTCQYCGAKPPDTVLEVDHVHPRSLGGLDTLDNLKTACWNCNRGKGCIPIIRVTKYLLESGPWDGRTYDFHLDATFPLLWIMRRYDGELAAYEDQWIDEDTMGDWGGQKVRFGHPGFNIEQQPRTGAELDFSGPSRNPNPLPTLLGAYWNPEPGTDALPWSDPERLIVELTA